MRIHKILFAILLVCSTIVTAQNLTISSSGDTGTSGTNWSITGTTLTVTGTASVDASVIENALANGNLSVVGNSTNFAVTVSEAINATTVGYGLTIGSMTNAGAITISDDISLAGGIAIMGGNVQLNGNITSTATGDLFFQGIGDVWSIRLATGKTIEKTAGTGLLTMQGNGRINNSTSVGSILASGTARLDVVIINEMDEGTAGLYNVSTGNITTNGGHLWISAGAKTRVWNGFSVGSTGVPGNADYNGIDVTGNISTNGGDILLWAFVGSAARGAGYGDITALSTNRTISSGSGDITLMTRYNDFVNGSPDISISTTGTLSLAPASGSSFDVGLSYAGTTTSGTFTGSGGMDGLIIQNMTSLPALVIGTYLGTGVSGDSPYTSSNTATITLAAAISISGPITINGGIILAQQNITSTLSGADILLQATGYIDLAASRTIETNNGDISFRANSGGTAVVLPNSTTGAITLNSGSSLLSTGGNIILGGNYAGTEGAALYAASARVGGSPGILISNATLTAAGGNINIYGRCTTSYDDGIRLMATIGTTGTGNIGIFGDSYGGLTTDVFFGGITFITNSSTIETDAGNINIEATLTNTQSNGTYALNFYRTAYSTGTRGRDIQLLSRSGNIQVTGDPGSTAAGGMGSSSWGDIYAGSPADASFTASGSVTFTYSRFVGAGLNGIITKTTGAVTYEPTATSFANAQTFPHNSNYVVADGASSLTIGKSSNTSDITLLSPISIPGSITVYAGNIELYDDITSTNGGNISILGSSSIYTWGSGSTSRDLTTAGGTIRVEADSDANGVGLLNIDYMSFNSGSGPVIIRGETVSWDTGAESYKPFINTTGTFTYESNDASFGIDVSLVWFKIANGTGGITIGKTTNTNNVNFNSATALTVNGPVNVNGATLGFTTALTVSSSDLTLRSSAAVTQTAAITASGLSLNGTGTFTLNNTANNIATIAGGSSAAKIGSLSFVDAAGGLEIGTVNPTGITSTGPIKIETLEGNITLSENLATDDTTADAIILNAGKTAAIGTATGGDIIVSGTPTLTYGTGGRAKLFSGRNGNSTGLTALAGGVGNTRVNVDETTATFSPVLAVDTSYALYRAEDTQAPTISNFNNVNKMYFDGSYSIVAPTSNSLGAFTYTSSNTDVATISGTTVTILSAGTITITANQTADGNYTSASITATLIVTEVAVLTNTGAISSTNLNYVNQYGQIGGDFGLSANGAIVNAKTPEPSNAETGLVLNLDASNIASYSGTGTTWKDVSGNNRDGTLPAGVTYTTAGGIKYFNFSASYVAIDLPKNPSMTYFVWAKSSVTCSTPYMVLFHSGTTFANPQIGPSLFFRACYNYWNTQDGPGNPFSSGNYSTHGTNWHNYIVVNDAIANTTKLYYDGVLIGSAVYKHSSNTNLTIGNSSNLNAPWQGGIATFKAYNKALTDSEILNLYNSTKGVFGY